MPWKIIRKRSTQFFPRKFFDGTALPSIIDTNGWSGSSVELHFGFSSSSTRGENSIYFVVHPNSWGPYQKRFRTALNESTKEFDTLIKAAAKGGGAAASAGAGAFAAWYTGAAIAGGPAGMGVAAVGAAGAYIASDLCDRLTADYLRKIG